MLRTEGNNIENAHFYHTILWKNAGPDAHRKATLNCPTITGISSLTSLCPQNSCTCDTGTPRLRAIAYLRSPVVMSFVSNCIRSPPTVQTSTMSSKTGAKPRPRRICGGGGGATGELSLLDFGVVSPSTSDSRTPFASTPGNVATARSMVHSMADPAHRGRQHT